jgi:hypothetical protein
MGEGKGIEKLNQLITHKSENFNEDMKEKYE